MTVEFWSRIELPPPGYAPIALASPKAQQRRRAALAAQASPGRVRKRVARRAAAVLVTRRAVASTLARCSCSRSPASRPMPRTADRALPVTPNSLTYLAQ